MKNVALIHETLEDFFDHQILVKMFHFQTKVYGHHKAADAYLGKFLLNMDRFMEGAQGRYGIVKTTEFSTKLKMWTDKTAPNELRSFIAKLLSLSEPLQKDTDLLNIRDEMVADANQFIYLLNFN